MPKQRKSRGGGFTTQLSNMINPGNPVFQQYEGAGQDCAGTPTRPGFIDNYSGKGLPGLSGGRRSKRRSHGHKRRSHGHKRRSHGGTQLSVASFLPSAPGVPPHPVPQAAAQKGGRYEVNPGPIVAGSAIGMSGPSPVQRIACESGSYNELNGNREVQVATTAIPIKGGKRRHSKRRYSGGAALGYAPVSAAPTISVGDEVFKAYYPLTAGYRNDFEALPSGGAVPGLTLQIPYDARAGNPACGMSGGKRRVRFSRHSKKGGKRRSGSKRSGSKRSGSKRSDSKRSKRSKRGKRSCFSLKKLFRM